MFGHIGEKGLILALFGVLWRNGSKIWKNKLNPQSFYLQSVIWDQFDKYIQIYTVQNQPAKFATFPVFEA